MLFIRCSQPNLTLCSLVVHELERNGEICSRIEGYVARSASMGGGWVRIISLYPRISKTFGRGACTSNAEHYQIRLLQKHTSLCPYGGLSPKPPGLGLYPSIREPRRRVVVLIELQTCEMLRDFPRFHENAMFYHCLHEVNHCENW